MKNPVIEFKHLSKKAEHILNETFDCRKAEPVYLEILELIKQHPENRDEFINSMITMFNTGEGPWELIQFCMRDLQWHEIKEELIIQLNEAIDPREISVINHILAVYEPIWEDSDLYKYYSE